MWELPYEVGTEVVSKYISINFSLSEFQSRTANHQPVTCFCSCWCIELAFPRVVNCMRMLMLKALLHSLRTGVVFFCHIKTKRNYSVVRLCWGRVPVKPCKSRPFHSTWDRSDLQTSGLMNQWLSNVFVLCEFSQSIHQGGGAKRNRTAEHD